VGAAQASGNGFRMSIPPESPTRHRGEEFGAERIAQQRGVNPKQFARNVDPALGGPEMVRVGLASERRLRGIGPYHRSEQATVRAVNRGAQRQRGERKPKRPDSVDDMLRPS
jgi:hypothetical protein